MSTVAERCRNASLVSAGPISDRRDSWANLIAPITEWHGASARKILLCLFMIAIVVGLWSGSGIAATIELTREPDGTFIGVKVEGDIVSGDAVKLLKIYEYYGYAAASTVYLRSRGGNVEEAMKMGQLVRRLRLTTYAPNIDDNGRVLPYQVPSAIKDNFICASACFLVYVGGAERLGQLLVLRRPYLSKEEGSNLSDVDHEAAEKRVMAEIRDYLRAMEVDQFFIDKMMSTSSEDGYVVTVADVLAHGLNKIVPSIGEIVLSMCNVPTLQENSHLQKTGDAALFAKSIASADCQDKQMDDLRRGAWGREHEDLLQAKCNNLTGLGLNDFQALQDLVSKGEGATLQEKQSRARLSSNYFSFTQCRSIALYQLTFAAMKRWEEAARGASRQ
jgi:hypothetical protein